MANQRPKGSTRVVLYGEKRPGAAIHTSLLVVPQDEVDSSCLFLTARRSSMQGWVSATIKRQHLATHFVELGRLWASRGEAVPQALTGPSLAAAFRDLAARNPQPLVTILSGIGIRLSPSLREYVAHFAPGHSIAMNEAAGSRAGASSAPHSRPMTLAGYAGLKMFPRLASHVTGIAGSTHLTCPAFDAHPGIAIVFVRPDLRPDRTFVSVVPLIAGVSRRIWGKPVDLPLDEFGAALAGHRLAYLDNPFENRLVQTGVHPNPRLVESARRLAVQLDVLKGQFDGVVEDDPDAAYEADPLVVSWVPRHEFALTTTGGKDFAEEKFTGLCRRVGISGPPTSPR